MRPPAWPPPEKCTSINFWVEKHLLNGIHDNPSPFTMTCLGIDGYTIQSWPRNSKRKSVGNERGLPGNVFSLLERTPRQRRPFSLLRLGVIPWINPLISTIPPCGENRDDICKSLGHSIHSTHCSYYYFYYSNEVILQKSKFSVIHALKWYNSASSLKDG